MKVQNVYSLPVDILLHCRLHTNISKVLEENVDDKVTLVLPRAQGYLTIYSTEYYANRLMIDDAHRALLLVGTLQAHSSPTHQSIQEVPSKV